MMLVDWTPEQLRELRGQWTLREFEREVGIHYVTLSRLENGASMGVDTIRKLTEYARRVGKLPREAA